MTLQNSQQNNQNIAENQAHSALTNKINKIKRLWYLPVFWLCLILIVIFSPLFFGHSNLQIRNWDIRDIIRIAINWLLGLSFVFHFITLLSSSGLWIIKSCKKQSTTLIKRLFITCIIGLVLIIILWYFQVYRYSFSQITIRDL